MIHSKTSEYVNSVFEQPWWLDVVAPNGWKEIIIEENGNILARWPIVENRKGVVMPKMTQTLGYWLSEKILENDTCNNETKRITNLLLEQLPKKKDINICLNSKIHYFLPMYWMHFLIKPKISYRLNDLKDLDAIYSRFPEMVKRNIRRAKNKVEIKAIDDIEILIALLDRTFSRQNMKNPWSKELIRKIYKVCKEYSACKLLYAIGNDGIAYSGILFVYDRNVCYAWIGGTDPKYRSSGAFSSLIWEGIKFASVESKSFDFMGSMIEGIENFLRQFGGTPVVYYQIQKHRQSFIEIMFLKILKFSKQRVKAIIGYNNWYRS
jgi:hypothetical protein